MFNKKFQKVAPNRNQYCKKQGFSLVEVLVVIVIIIILSAIAVPRYGFIKGSAKILEAKYGLSDFYRQEQSFLIENGHYSASVDDIGFKWNSKNYKLGFHNSYKGATVNMPLGSSCTVNSANNSFKAGTANQNNTLPNFTINEQNCMQKLKDNQSDCSKTESADCISQ